MPVLGGQPQASAVFRRSRCTRAAREQRARHGARRPQSSACVKRTGSISAPSADRIAPGRRQPIAALRAHRRRATRSANPMRAPRRELGSQRRHRGLIRRPGTDSRDAGSWPASAIPETAAPAIRNWPRRPGRRASRAPAPICRTRSVEMRVDFVLQQRRAWRRCCRAPLRANPASRCAAPVATSASAMSAPVMPAPMIGDVAFDRLRQRDRAHHQCHCATDQYGPFERIRCERIALERPHRTPA